MKKTAFLDGWTCNGQPVTLPHDAQIQEPRSKDASNGGHGYFPGGIYTYEKTFTAPVEWKGKRRCKFIRAAVASVLAAKEDGVPVTGYMHWSLTAKFPAHSGWRTASYMSLWRIDGFRNLSWIKHATTGYFGPSVPIMTAP